VARARRVATPPSVEQHFLYGAIEEAQMKAEIEAARRGSQRTSELAIAAQHARERHARYEAETDGSKLTSFARLRELEQARDGAEARLRRAQETPDDDQPELKEDLPDLEGEPIEIWKP
jgi:hypothetical protein